MTFLRVVCAYQHEQEIVPVVNSVMYMQELNILASDWGSNAACHHPVVLGLGGKGVRYCSVMLSRIMCAILEVGGGVDLELDNGLM